MPAVSGTVYVACPVVDIKNIKLGCCRDGVGVWDSCEQECAFSDCV